MTLSNEAKALLGVGITTVILLIGGIFFFNRSANPNTPAETVDRSILVKNDSNTITAANAHVTVVEFGDFQCPACKAANPVVKQILATYEGKINFVFRNYPLPSHRNAKVAAQAAEAAGAQGKYWEMHNLLYDTQSQWSNMSDPVETFTLFAKRMGLDIDTFKQQVESDAFTEKIEQDVTDGNRAGVRATPTFYVNGVKVQNVSDLSDAIDEALRTQ